MKDQKDGGRKHDGGDREPDVGEKDGFRKEEEVGNQGRRKRNKRGKDGEEEGGIKGTDDKKGR